jgi:large subunit ribosomal protein L23
MPNVYQVIERPIITEKALGGHAAGKYAFVVHADANKFQIREAIETLFTTPEGTPIVVVDVNTAVIKGKTKRFRSGKRIVIGKTPDYKKAVVTLAEGQSIQLFEGV